MCDNKEDEKVETTRGKVVKSSKLLDALLQIKSALHKTGEFNNYECFYGHRLGTCPNDFCLPCRVKNALDGAGI